MTNNEHIFHAFVTLDEMFYPDGSLELRDRLNRGEKLTPEELSILPYSKVINEIKIDNSDDVISLINIVSSNCDNPHNLFEIDGLSYNSFLVDPSDMRIQQFFLNHIKKRFPEFWDTWVNNDIDDILISFPEKMEM
ncbi:hypothetical protein [Xenorhabdus sp. KJ12.1]|uniref:hypothetical protein n=1 Tax=Xenorhabdus sp. KJ12.1 TaxID=1851571 RepID=UPI000C04B428|nr:hypothetical protein [Xenorhabdus sp. KJ12.1]PHM67985.1 hypothetical protein Xekj_03708 [Xenorhabdus sp. KJ12.1]